nr:MAG TPA: hypothetical protein [Caudoviricetes sp.]
MPEKQKGVGHADNRNDDRVSSKTRKEKTRQRSSTMTMRWNCWTWQTTI